jgi:acyl carrier protein
MVEIMENKDIKELICKLFLGGDTSFPLEPDTDLLQEGICDSLALVQLATQLETACPPIRIHDAEITPENLGSIARIGQFLKCKQAE